MDDEMMEKKHYSRLHDLEMMNHDLETMKEDNNPVQDDVVGRPC